MRSWRREEQLKLKILKGEKKAKDASGSFREYQDWLETLPREKELALRKPHPFKSRVMRILNRAEGLFLKWFK